MSLTRYTSCDMFAYANEISWDLYHIAYKRSAVYIATAFMQLYRARETSISQKEKSMDKTIKELAVELTVELTGICDTIKGRTVFTNQVLRSCSSIGSNSFEANMHKAEQILLIS